MAALETVDDLMGHGRLLRAGSEGMSDWLRPYPSGERLDKNRIGVGSGLIMTGPGSGERLDRSGTDLMNQGELGRKGRIRHRLDRP